MRYKVEKSLFHFDPVDHEQMKLLGSLPPQKRVRAMLDARELAVGLLRGRLRQSFPKLTEAELNLMVLEATTHAVPFEVWCARPEDVILGKLMAWDEVRSRKHETDIDEIMVFHYLRADPALSSEIDVPYIDQYSASLGNETIQLWEAIKEAAQREANR